MKSDKEMVAFAEGVAAFNEGENILTNPYNILGNSLEVACWDEFNYGYFKAQHEKFNPNTLETVNLH